MQLLHNPAVLLAFLMTVAEEPAAISLVARDEGTAVVIFNRLLDLELPMSTLVAIAHHAGNEKCIQDLVAWARVNRYAHELAEELLDLSEELMAGQSPFLSEGGILALRVLEPEFQRAIAHRRRPTQAYVN